MQDAFRRLRRGIWAVALSASLPAPAPAETWSYGAFFYDTRLPDALILQGEITDGLTYGLRKALREHDVKVVLLDSPGGAVFEGLEISAIIRDKGLSTLIPPDAICASACSFLFVAGVRRQAAGALGVHQFASANDMEPASEGDTQHVAAEILDFLREYDVPLIFMVRMLETPNDTMYWFPEAELKKEGLVTGDSFDAEIAAWNALPRQPAPEATPEPQAEPEPEPGAAPTPGANPFAPETRRRPSNPFGGRPAAGPSFDCADASTETEQAICADLHLAELDVALDRAYRAAADTLSRIAFGVVRVEQARWLAQRDACGSDAACIERAYSERIDAIERRMRR